MTAQAIAARRRLMPVDMETRLEIEISALMFYFAEFVTGKSNGIKYVLSLLDKSATCL